MRNALRSQVSRNALALISAIVCRPTTALVAGVVLGSLSYPSQPGVSSPRVEIGGAGHHVKNRCGAPAKCLNPTARCRNQPAAGDQRPSALLYPPPNMLSIGTPREFKIVG
jgi:hypothetical protein